MDKLSTVILGQDPYYTPNTADGMAFSCKTKIPKSLQVIFRAIETCYGVPVNRNPDLTRWAEQGVLLLNTALTVVPMSPASQSLAWESFTESLIIKLSTEFPNLNWLLWGKHAQYYSRYIFSGRVFTDIHPAARRGIFRGHFDKVKEVKWT